MTNRVIVWGQINKEGSLKMIVAYGGKNCWGFKDWMEIDFRINKNVPDQYAFEGVRLVPALCFEGANASGKSCALKVLSFIVDFCLNSFSYKPNTPIFYDTFFYNNDKSEFYLKFLINSNINREYKYEVTLDKHKVYKESLYYIDLPNKTKTYIAKRKNNEFTSTLFEGDADKIILKSNSSLISTCIQYGIDNFKDIFEFLDDIDSNVIYTGTYVDQLKDNASEYYYNNDEVLKRTVNIIREFDLGLSDIKINKVVDHGGNDIYISNFVYDVDDSARSLSYINQSTGTKLLYNRLLDFIRVLDNGGVLVFDELDTHLHTGIIHLLLNMFLDRRINKNKAQLVFTSHDTAILNLLRKYRVYLFNKDNGESICYRIDELPDNICYRNDRSLEQAYLSGAIGGTPNVKK